MNQPTALTTLSMPIALVAPLEPPTPPAIVEPAQVESLVKLDPAVVPGLDQQVAQFVDDIMRMQVGTDGFNGRVDDVHKLGAAAIADSAMSSSRLLKRSVRAMNSGAFDDKAGVGKALSDLRTKMDELSPRRYGDLLEPRRILGLFPFGTKLKAYFESYQSAETHIATIFKRLSESKDELLRDNADIDQEKQRLWDALQKLEQYVYLARAVDARLEQKALELDVTDPLKAKVVREELLFAVRQRVADLLTQAAVSVQGYLSMDIIRKTNFELIKGVDRASTTTISALRTAVVTAQALGTQKLVLEQVKGLNEATGDMILATSEMLKSQSTEVYQQAASPMLAVEKLQAAFDNTFATFDMLADFKTKSLDSLQTTIDTLAGQIDRAKSFTDVVRQSDLRDLAAEVGSDDGLARL